MKKMIVVGATTLLFFTMSVTADESGAGTGREGVNKAGFFGKLRDHMQQRRNFNKAKDWLGLGDDAGRDDVKAALCDKLGLPEDASREEIRDAMKAHRDEMKTALDAAIDSGDYAAWSALMADTPRGEDLLDKITEDNFPKYAEARIKMREAKAIMDELGLSHGPGQGKGPRGGFGQGNGPQGGPGGMGFNQ